MPFIRAGAFGRRRYSAACLWLLAALACTVQAGEPAHRVERSVIVPSGGTATGGGYTLQGSAAQPLAGHGEDIATGGYHVHAGFWQAAPAAPRPDPIFRNGFEQELP